MLQQTTVKTVIPYFERFLKKFPTLQIFAKSDEQDYLSLWQGLGYYNRIRNFHKAATFLLQNNSSIPTTKAELIKLPGLGDYTASAIASIAFGEGVAVVDGNVMRVLSRLFAYEKDSASKEAKVFFWKKAQELLDKKQAGDFNQAMMELGATVCTPKNPICLYCPVNSHCQAFKQGNPEKFPVKSQKIIYKNEDHLCEIRINKNKILLRKRSSKEIMAGLWEFPLILGTPKKNQETLSQIRHSIMNRRLTIYPILIKSASVRKTHEAWVLPQDLKNYPLTTITRKVLKILSKNDRNSLFPQGTSH